MANGRLGLPKPACWNSALYSPGRQAVDAESAGGITD
jgi:hypothetical protein